MAYPLVATKDPGWYTAGPLRAFITNDPSDGWHLSVSRRDRIPSWEEILTIKRELVPAGVFMMVCVPPDEHWMNGMHNVIQLVEIRPADRGDELIQHMKDTAANANAEGWNMPPSYGKDLTRAEV